MIVQREYLIRVVYADDNTVALEVMDRYRGEYVANRFTNKNAEEAFRRMGRVLDSEHAANQRTPRP